MGFSSNVSRVQPDLSNLWTIKTSQSLRELKWIYECSKLLNFSQLFLQNCLLFCITIPILTPQQFISKKRNELYADKINLRNLRWRSSWISRYFKTQWLLSLWDKEEGSLRQENREGSHVEMEAKIGSDAAPRQGMPGATRSCKRWGRILCKSLWKGYFLPQLWFLWFSDSKTEKKLL